jgi:DNA-directed RNA polymerase subunit L
MKTSTIKLKKKSWDKEVLNSRLEFNISGNNINEVYLNSIRRTVFSDIPIYVYDDIKINKNTSVFHNNYLKLRIKNIPVLGIKNNNLFFKESDDKNLNEDYDDQLDFQDNLDFSINENVNISSLNQLTMYLEKTNDTNEIITATTADAKFYIAQKNIPSPYKTPIPIVDLQPSQEITLTAVTKLGIEKKSSIYSPVSVNFYKKNKENDFDYILESRGQLSETRILEVALENLNKLLEELSEKIPEGKGIEDKLVIPNADHTLGNLISNAMYNHPSVTFSGYNMPHPLDEKIIINYKLKNGNLKKIMKEVINYYINLNNKLKKEISNIK